MKRILVTGAAGFIGRHIARHFAERGWNVVGLGHGGWPPEEWRKWGLTEWVTSDVNLEALMQFETTPDVIAHCGGSGSVGFSVNHPALDFGRTVDGTMHVLEYIRIKSPKSKLLYPSSAAVYGAVKKLPISEGDALSPVSPYGVHKRIAEELIQSYARHFGVASTIVRIFSAYGVELRKQLLWDACNKARRGETEFPGDGQETRDFIFSSDFADVFFKAIDHASPECVVANAGCGQAVTVREVAEFIFEKLGNGARPRFNGRVRAGDPRDYSADISVARSWGWSPQVGWRAGLTEYIEWMQKEGGV
jgi:UDP-glucose 4-epimerase